MLYELRTVELSLWSCFDVVSNRKAFEVPLSHIFRRAVRYAGSFGFIKHIMQRSRSLLLQHGFPTFIARLAEPTCVVDEACLASQHAARRGCCSPAGSCIRCTSTSIEQVGWLQSSPTATAAAACSATAATGSSYGCVAMYRRIRQYHTFLGSMERDM